MKILEIKIHPRIHAEVMEHLIANGQSLEALDIFQSFTEELKEKDEIKYADDVTLCWFAAITACLDMENYEVATGIIPLLCVLCVLDFYFVLFCATMHSPSPCFFILLVQNSFRSSTSVDLSSRRREEVTLPKKQLWRGRMISWEYT
jgi:hypothetical protein